MVWSKSLDSAIRVRVWVRLSKILSSSNMIWLELLSASIEKQGPKLLASSSWFLWSKRTRQFLFYFWGKSILNQVMSLNAEQLGRRWNNKGSHLICSNPETQPLWRHFHTMLGWLQQHPWPSWRQGLAPYHLCTWPLAHCSWTCFLKYPVPQFPALP